jgi:nucleotide-binding universal stress UspA family protein
MRKILLAFDGTNFSEGAFEFARQLNELSPALVTGVFLSQINYANVWGYAEGVMGTSYIPRVVDGETVAVHENIERFESHCQRNNIDYRVHKDFTEFSLAALKKESRFADILILGSESFYENLGINEPNESMKDALHNSECAVFIVPEKFEFPDTNVLSYDGSDDSVYAIKQFAYLFPEFCDNKTLLVYAKEEANGRFPDEQYIEELAARHFTDLRLLKLPAKPEDYFNTWIENRKGAVLISGAFGRSTISQIFKRSFTSDVITDHRLPVFIAHR